MAPNTVVNAFGRERCMSESGNYARATRGLHMCACGTAVARASQLPVTVYGVLELGAYIECGQVEHPVHLDMITLVCAGK